MLILPRDAMLYRYAVYAIVVCPSVCPSVTSRQLYLNGLGGQAPGGFQCIAVVGLTETPE